MPRHQKTPGQYAKKNSLRSRTFSIVIHDVHTGSKAQLETKINELEPDWSLVAEEPYNHQDGSHIHLFIKYDQPKAKSKVLSYIQNLDLGGRVQVDIGRGSFDECKKYITDPTKEKKLDNNITENVRKLTLIERYPDETYVCSNCTKKYYYPDSELPLFDQLCPNCSWTNFHEIRNPEILEHT